MDIFDGLYPQCVDSVDMEKSDTSEDSDMEVFLFKDNHANIFTTEVEPKLKGKGLSARDRRVLVTRIVAKAHSLTISAGNAKRHEVFKKMGYLPADPSEIMLRVLPSYTFVPMSEVEQHVQQMVAARAQAVPEPDPVCNLPPAKRQATITSLFRK
mmetsp:Transcript_46368/g.75979  ORF Transcript_46368/g.75979 Transcript_46368/m.75979 type:complete len:155 (-) Transcript_46368:36-500(-)